VFSRLARVLRPGGLCALSFETLPEAVAAGGVFMDVSDQLRFRHDPEKVKVAALAAGLRPVLTRETGLRLERGQPVAGFLLVLCRA